ncbi:MAG: hypothetical protein OEV44_10295 [Spirochaetota bacterium]|nr:hypothetical protein [Spirochaetota bacterium]
MGLRKKANFLVSEEIQNKKNHPYAKISNIINEFFYLDLNKSINNILLTCKKELGINKIILILENIDDNKKQFRIAGQIGYPQLKDDPVIFYENNELLKLIAKNQNTPVLLSEISKQLELSQKIGTIKKYDLELGLTLVNNDKIIGYLLIGKRDGDIPYKDDDLNFLEFISFFGGFIIKSALKWDQMNATIENLKESYNIDKINQFTKQINTLEKEVAKANKPLRDEDLKGIYKKILASLDHIFSIKIASILFKNQQGNYIISESIGLNEETMVKFLLSDTSEIFKDFFENHNPLILDQYRKIPEIVRGLSSIDLSSSDFFLILPLTVSNELFGIINILKMENKILTSSSINDIKLFSVISAYLSYFFKLLLKANSVKLNELESIHI